MPDSAILAGELYLAHLRRLQSLSDSHERAGFSKQFQDIVRIYADLIDVRTEIDSMFGGGGGTATTEEIRSLLGEILRSRSDAMGRHASTSRWSMYYAERFYLPWIPSLCHLARIYTHSKWGWFDPESSRDSIKSIRLACGLGPRAKVIPINAAA